MKLEWIDRWLSSERETMIMYDTVYIKLYLQMKLSFLVGKFAAK